MCSLCAPRMSSGRPRRSSVWERAARHPAQPRKRHTGDSEEVRGREKETMAKPGAERTRSAPGRVVPRPDSSPSIGQLCVLHYCRLVLLVFHPTWPRGSCTPTHGGRVHFCLLLSLAHGMPTKWSEKWITHQPEFAPFGSA